MWIRISQSFPLPQDVRETLMTLKHAGHEAYLVGGCVRDFLLGDKTFDYDIATSATPEEVAKLFPKVVEVGRAFGVMKVITDSRQVEVATFRSESDYKDHRHPSKIKFTDAKGDAERRDFTVNAMFFDPSTNQLLDFFNGQEDLKNKVLRAIGKPEERFQEDALRLLRAVRFSARLGFTIEEATKKAIQEQAPLIRKISIERVRDELEKILMHSSSRNAMLELDALGLMENVFPEISVAILQQSKVWEQTLRALKVLGGYSTVEPKAFYWAMVMLPTIRLLSMEKREEEAISFGMRMKFSQEAISQLAYLVRETPKFRDVFSMREVTLLRWMKESDFELLMRFHDLEASAFDGNKAGLEFVRSIYSDAKRRFAMKPLLTGDDLVKLGMNPGRQFSEILRTVEDMTLEGRLTSTDQALEFVLQHYVR